MIIRPVFNILLLPDITYFFKRDFFPGAAADQIEGFPVWECCSCFKTAVLL